MKAKLLRALVRLCPLLLALIMVSSLSPTALEASPAVSFEGGNLIVFAPGSLPTASNLFAGFQTAMPGDSLEQKITVQNNSSTYDYIKVYLRALPHDVIENPLSDQVKEMLQADERRGGDSELVYMHDFLAQLSLTVRTGTEEIFHDSPQKLGSLADNVLLGKLGPGESLELSLELKLPPELDNKYANRIGEVDWVFSVEGFDQPTSAPEDDTLLTVRKVWQDDPQERPDSVTVQLLRDGEPHAEQELNEANHWVYTWDGLDSNYEWSVRETNIPEGYEVTHASEANTITIVNTKNPTEPTEPTNPTEPTEPLEPDEPTEPTEPPQPSEPEFTPEIPNPDKPSPPLEPVAPVNLSVVKKWDNLGNKRPDSVQITLYNGTTAVESVVLGAWNNWSYTWYNLDGHGNWQLIETHIPPGYVPSYAYANGVVTVTNTASLIHTGRLNWPIPVLGGLGLVLVVAGIFLVLKKRKTERA
ncbi:MAG: Cna B-type domain-containing protein [Eubacteriales bacterium]|nr:Cna B-type domain-containing protein [Eubacteriales bacterium]